MNTSFGLGGVSEAVGHDTGISAGTLVTADAVDNAMGAWQEIVASTARPTNELVIAVLPGTNTFESYLVNLSTEPGGSEGTRLLVEGLSISIGNSPHMIRVPLPIYLPAGSRIAAQCQCSTGGESLRISAQLHAHGAWGRPGHHRIAVLGANFGNSQGTALALASATDTKSAWTQFTASAPFDIRQLMFLQARGLGTTDRKTLIDVGVGPSGSEVVVRENIETEDRQNFPQVFGPFDIDVPAGSRLALRYQSTELVIGPVLTVAVFG